MIRTTSPLCGACPAGGALRLELAETRERGYATSDGKSEPDLCTVAALVRDRRGRPRAAIAATAPRSRTDEQWAEKTAVTVTRIAKELSERVG